MNSTKISFVDVQLNKGKPYEPMIMIENDNGILLVDKGLFVISFESKENMEKMNVKVCSKL